ncbi:HlyD family efflux transporter periplasmic adaptor subunit [Salmonella enterica]|nr:HlyD family efflux transporter periplasmic adaptor subunit [Salmonella enterica]EAY8676653.1 HlyD family efflux transporter periplasmic adaptor subunit [Salmonella enterica]EBB7877725.1 HlyD family efflux transporter periplasmic adaptor subunit [Salmonella enterica]
MALVRSYKSTQNSRDNILTELSNIDIINNNEVSEIERRIIDINTSLIYLKTQKNVASISPINGKVTNAIVSLGQSVNINYPIATIIPDNSIWEALLLVPSNDIGFIQNGMKTNIRYKSFPYQKFGQFEATIISVSRAPLSSAELSINGISDSITTNTDIGYYQVIAKLKEQTIKTTINTLQLQAGMLLEADILHEKKRFYEWITDPILSLTKNK